MKYLLRVLFILALFCGVTSHARADNFHMQVLDPNICFTDPSVCLIFNNSEPITISLNAETCKLAGVPDLPAGSDYGCAVLFNLTGEDITSLNITFSGLEGLTFDCETSVPGSIFADNSCGSSGGGVDTFSFYGGVLAPFTLCDPSSGEAIIYENGVSPDLFQGGTADVNEPPILFTPEPDSLLLLSTGAMMMTAGLFVKRQRRLFALGKK